MLYLVTGIWVMVVTIQIFFSILAFFAKETPGEMRRPLSAITLVLAIVSGVTARILLNFRSDYYGLGPVPATDLAVWAMMITMLLGLFVVIVFTITFKYIWRGNEQA